MNLNSQAYLSKLEKIQGLIHERQHNGSENTPGWGAKGIGAPPLIKTSFDTRLALRRPSTAANAHLKHGKENVFQHD